VCQTLPLGKRDSLKSSDADDTHQLESTGDLVIAAVQSIGIARHAPVPCALRIGQGSLVSSLAAWRRRACSIALGNCGRKLVTTVRPRPSMSFADYLEIRNQRAIPDALSTVETDQPNSPTRIWPIHRPLIESNATQVGSSQNSDESFGNYIDIII
jgi:hypothetical protein